MLALPEESKSKPAAWPISIVVTGCEFRIQNKAVYAYGSFFEVAPRFRFRSCGVSSL